MYCLMGTIFNGTREGVLLALLKPGAVLADASTRDKFLWVSGKRFPLLPIHLSSFDFRQSGVLRELSFSHLVCEDSRYSDRYGAKYAWIAFYELARSRRDQGILKLSRGGELGLI
jgi:hypothetical protein